MFSEAKYRTRVTALVDAICRVLQDWAADRDADVAQLSVSAVHMEAIERTILAWCSSPQQQHATTAVRPPAVVRGSTFCKTAASSRKRPMSIDEDTWSALPPDIQQELSISSSMHILGSSKKQRLGCQRKMDAFVRKS